jgi:ABC-type Zn uptake system ZnuABC Zn-binding protein ZnuA
VLIATAGAVLGAAACAGGGSDGDGEESRRVVVATTTQIAAIVREVARDAVDLRVLIGPGVNPHDYEPSAQEIRLVADSALVLRNGAGLDDFLDDAIEGSGVELIVTVTDGIELRPAAREEEHADEDEHGAFDPHVWHDPTNVQVMAGNVAEALAEVFPEDAATFRENAAAYNARLDEVDAEMRALIDSIPEAGRMMVTAHDSLGYFLDRYGLEFVGAVVPSTTSGAETSARELAALQDLITSLGVKAIFAEATVDPSVAERLAVDTGVRVVTDLYGDSLGPEGSDAATIDGMLLHNARLIAEALK